MFCRLLKLFVIIFCILSSRFCWNTQVYSFWEAAEQMSIELLKPIDGFNVICFDKADADIYWPDSAILILGWCGLSISSMGPFKQGHYHKAGNWNVEPQLKSFCKLFKISSIIYRINRFYSIFEKALVS